MKCIFSSEKNVAVAAGRREGGYGKSGVNVNL